VRPAFSPVLVLFSLLAVCTAAADDTSASAGVVCSVDAAVGADTSLREIVTSAFAVQLSRRQALTEMVSSAPGRSSTQPAEGLAAASGRHAQFFLLGQYSTSPRDFTLRVDLYDVAAAKLVRSSSASGRIDLSLDSVVAEVLDKAFSGIALRQVAEAAPVLAALGAPNGPAAIVVDGTAGAASRSDGVRRLFTISSGAAPFIPLGGTGTYANLGILATVSANYRFPLGPGVLGAGLLSGVCVLDAAGAATDARLLMVPIGADVRYTMNEGGFPGIVVHVSAGPAMMNVNADYSGSLTKVVPYLLAGMSLDLPFSPSMGLAVEAAWAAFLESLSLPIMAFAPEVLFYVRF
jgi:hypothetical protein